jgi:SAM-dependent methyltransferase
LARRYNWEPRPVEEGKDYDGTDVTTPDDLVEHYAHYYGDEELKRWRELGARDKAQNILSLCSTLLAERPTVVDIGCGDGAVIEALDSVGFARSYVGLEISPSGVRVAQARAYTTPTSFQVYAGTQLPVDSESFDLAVLSHVLEHVKDPRHLIGEAARVARYVFVEVPLELNVRVPHDFHWTEVGHINLFNPIVLRHLVQSTGLHVERETVTCSSRAVTRALHPGWKGDLRWGVKTAVLNLSRKTATAIFTYNGALVARSVRHRAASEPAAP